MRSCILDDTATVPKKEGGVRGWGEGAEGNSKSSQRLYFYLFVQTVSEFRFVFSLLAAWTRNGICQSQTS